MSQQVRPAVSRVQTTDRRWCFVGLLHEVADGGTIGAVEPIPSFAAGDGHLFHVRAQLREQWSVVTR